MIYYFISIVLTVQFTAEAYEVLETDGTVTVCVNKSLETAVVFSLNLEPTAITAEGIYIALRYTAVTHVYYVLYACSCCWLLSW